MTWYKAHYVKTMSSTKPEKKTLVVTKPVKNRARTTVYMHKIWWSSTVGFLGYASRQTNRQTDTLIAIVRTPSRSEAIITVESTNRDEQW